MPQERYNSVWIKENNAGIVLDSFKTIRGGVEEMIGRLEEFRRSLSHIHNRAVFEIPSILERILQNDQARARSARLGRCPSNGAPPLTASRH